MASKQDIRNLVTRIRVFAEKNSVTSVHAYRVCARHLGNAVRANAGPARQMGIQHAYTHFQFLKAAAIEKATRRG